MEVKQVDDNTREIRLEMDKLEEIMVTAEVIDGGEAIHSVRIEPGELIMTIVQEIKNERM